MNKNKHSRSSSGDRRSRTNNSGSSKRAKQGARSKINQKTDSNKNSNAKGRFPYQLAKHIPVLWDSITFCFTERKHAIHCKQSLRLDIGKVQFALTSSRKEKSYKILKKNGIEVNLNEKQQIEVKFLEQLNETNDELKYLEKIFEEDIIFDLDSKGLDAESPEGKRFIKEIEIKRKPVAAYHCVATNTLYLVSEKPEKQKMPLMKEFSNIPKSENRKPTIEKDLSLPDRYLLGYLGFEEHILNAYTNAEVHVCQNAPVCIVKSCNPNIKVDDEILRFLTKVKRKTLKVSGDLIERLLFDQYPEPNVVFYSFIRRKLINSHADISFYISKSDTRAFIVNCLNENEVQKVADMVHESIVSETVKVTWGEDGWDFFKEWSDDKKKLFYKKISPEWIELCCTNDVHMKFHKMIMNIDSSTSLSLSDNKLRALLSFGNDVLLGLEKQFGICARVKESELELTGKLEDIRKGEDYLKSELRKYRKSVPLDVPIECIENRKDEIDREMNKRECVWTLKTIQKPVKMLKHCKYLASWIDPMRELKVTVVRGISWDMDLDLQIVMTNQSLCPMEIVQFKVPDDFILRGTKIIGHRGRNMDVGEYTELLKEMNDCENVNCVALVIASDFDYKTSKGVDIRLKIKEILTKNVKSNITNFGLSAFEGVGAQKLTRQAIEAALELADAGPGQINEIFICCQTEPTQELRKVHELLKEKHGFVLNIYSDYAKVLKHTDPDTKIKVVEGSIEKLKADVMVNTTNSALKLDEGGVSSSILEMAGSKIQKECKKKYRDGLKKGQIAKTSAHELKNLKFVYHISLPDYNMTTFREDIKTYVKKCLCQAERDECCCIVFPALGVGRLKYPRRETAEAMFDAAEEYSLNVINPVLTSIKFLVNVNDKMTYEAFRGEEYRRSKRCLKEIGRAKPLIKKDFKCLVFRTGQHSPSIKITSLQDFGVPPAYAVEVFLGHVKTEEEIYLKKASDEPPSWNDRWFLQRPESINKVTEGLRKLNKKLTELHDRVTEIVIYTNKDSTCKIAEEQQAKQIFSVFSTTKTVFLQEVVIVVSDEPSLQRTATLLKKDVDRKNTNSRNTELSIELIGKTKEYLDGGETFIMDFVQRIKQENNAYVVSRLPSSKNDFEVFDEVTAEINPGIVDFKKRNKDWDAWVKGVEKIFTLKVCVSSDVEVTVRGDFSCILRFEDYLDKCFPNDPSAINDS